MRDHRAAQRGSPHQTPREDTGLRFATETFTRIRKAAALFASVFLETPFPAESDAIAESARARVLRSLFYHRQENH